MCDNLNLCCAVCRIGIYSVFRRICGKNTEVEKPEFNPICIGLTKAGKTTVLALLSGEKASDLEPTSGFSIKAVLFDDCILNIKEIGGADNIRPYWSHYFKDAHGVIFVVDASSSDEDLQSAKDELHKSLQNAALSKVPCLIIATHEDVDGSRSEEELKKILEWNSICDRQPMVFGLSSMNDIPALKSIFGQFNEHLKSRLQSYQNQRH